MTAAIRRIEARDQQRWRELWDGYTRFYEREPSESIAQYTWARITDPASPVCAIVAEREGDVIGIANYIIHENASALTPVCYLQDLYVDPAKRGAGRIAASCDMSSGTRQRSACLTLGRTLVDIPCRRWYN